MYQFSVFIPVELDAGAEEISKEISSWDEFQPSTSRITLV